MTHFPNSKGYNSNCENVRKMRNSFTKYKSRLLSRGVIGERPDGTLDFDLPGFREYLGDRMPVSADS